MSKILKEDDYERAILPEGVNTTFNGMMHSCTVKELIKILTNLDKEFPNSKIGIYDGFGQYSLMLDTEEKNIGIYMSCYN